MLLRRLLMTLFVLVVTATTLAQQTPASDAEKKAPKADVTFREPSSDIKIKRLPQNLWEDQKRIWTSPVHLRSGDINWIIPLTFASALTFGSDHEIERQISTSASTIRHATTFSNVGAAAFAGLVGAQYLWGIHAENDKLRETGFLSGEAAVDTILLTELTKGIARRERPTDGMGQGRFFKSPSPFGSSFVSQHSAAAFSIATVVSQEYPGILTKLFAYGGATSIGAARIIGDKHFASDVLLGSALGYFVGRQVYAGHSQEGKLDQMYGTFEKEKKVRNPSMMGSGYVPLDSWVYGVFDRLNALGLTPNATLTHRPWTRLQCARLVADMPDLETDPSGILENPSGTALSLQMIDDLKREFSRELRLLDGDRNLDFQVESIYTRFTGIAGQPLTDAMHFGQTIINDFGRPYEKGLNNVTGIEANATAGPFAFFLRGEFQHSPSASPYSLATRAAISQVDFLPVQPGTHIPAVNQFEALESYLALNMNNWQLSFGKQALSWGYATSTDFIMSNNAEPLTMLKLSNTAPVRLPSIFGLLGPLSSTTFVGRMQGYHFLRLGPNFQLQGSWDTYVNPQPYIWGDHLSFRPTVNFEFGVSFTSVWAGRGIPATLSAFRHTFSGNGNSQAVEPGDRRTGFDFSYRVPGLRPWLTIYSGSMAEDEPLPLFYPRRSGWNPGLYLVKFPRLNRLDLRVESVYSDLPNLRLTGYFYVNSHYANGYTSDGNIIGSWIGPEARGIQVTSNYWIGTFSRLTAVYRNETVNPAYLGGGNLSDFTGRFSFGMAGKAQVTTSIGYERWDYRVLNPLPKSNLTAVVELRWRNLKLRK